MSDVPISRPPEFPNTTTWPVVTAPPVFVTIFETATSELLIILPEASKNAGTLPIIDEPALVTTFDATMPESVTILPLEPENVARFPDVELPEFDTILSAVREFAAPDINPIFVRLLAAREIEPDIVPPAKGKYEARADVVASELRAVPES